ncbi:hypothetical protein D9613_004378 [Agrocybe pediades]|uniref:Fungal-type protein kinase domain-containing protein n=1 Tax=Agrocybe pediades TaxID=84607 RepID=A0A8H4QKJ4_9AGAR|nr:hypothetical protein D9613_004378 [Agrocybe pediades]
MPLSTTTTSRTNSVNPHLPIVAEEISHDIHVPCIYNKVFNPTFGLSRKKRITQYLEDSSKYDSKRKRWDIPSKTALEEDLYHPFEELISDILAYFEYTETRSVVRSANANMHHEEVKGVPRCEDDDEWEFKSSPDIVVTGHGKIEKEIGYNFGPADHDWRTRPTYANLVTPFEVTLDKNFEEEVNFLQIGVYARQCFIQQHNRQSVYALLISQKRARLYVFDRSGACHSEDINIHKNAEVFVRIILGICSPDCAAVGFDTSIYWSDDGTRRIQALDENKNLVAYRIKDPDGKPLFHAGTIKGRGTCCWAVEGGLVVKDRWTSVEQTPEVDFLEVSRGLPFVGQMVAYITGTSTAKLRGFHDYERDVSPEDKKHFDNRYFHRVTLKDGGKPFLQFSSPEEVLYAIRDAIRGHKNLWDSGILHRDISINNILITRSDTVPYGGTLIDLDMAVWIDRANSPEAKDFRAGTQAFQSVGVLDSNGSEKNTSKAPHDHLDDFESVLYVLCSAAMGFEGPGKMTTHAPRYLRLWPDVDPSTASYSKFGFIRRRNLPTTQPFFGPIFDRLIHDLRGFLRPHVDRKWANAETNFPALACLKECARNDYTTVLGFFDKAIADLEADDGFKERNKPVPPDETKTPGGSSRILGKRARSDSSVAGDTRRRSKRIIEKKKAKRTASANAIRFIDIAMALNRHFHVAEQHDAISDHDTGGREEDEFSMDHEIISVYEELERENCHILHYTP